MTKIRATSLALPPNRTTASRKIVSARPVTDPSLHAALTLHLTAPLLDELKLGNDVLLVLAALTYNVALDPSVTPRVLLLAALHSNVRLGGSRLPDETALRHKMPLALKDVIHRMLFVRFAALSKSLYDLRTSTPETPAGPKYTADASRRDPVPPHGLSRLCRHFEIVLRATMRADPLRQMPGLAVTHSPAERYPVLHVTTRNLGRKNLTKWLIPAKRTTSLLLQKIYAQSTANETSPLAP